MKKKITWVIKFSKLCNFRCSYCYEFPWLHDRSRIPTEKLPVLFRQIRAISHHFGSRPQICWHGGEPLLLPKKYLGAVASVCKETFAQDLSEVTHTIQTNLSVLTDWHIEFLRKQFQIVGVSFDPFGDSRIYASGYNTNRKVLENADHLRRSGVRIGCISVLTQENVKHIDETFSFFNDAGTNFRILPYYRAASIEQTSRHGLTICQTVNALTRLFDLWLAHGKGILIEPLDQYLNNAMCYAMETVVQGYDKKKRERVLVVNTDGSIYAVADTYDTQYCYGNIFSDSIDDILSAAGRTKAIIEADARIQRNCEACLFGPSCSGWYAGEATTIEREMMKRSVGCGVPFAVIHHIYSRLGQEGIFKELRSLSSSISTKYESMGELFV